MKKLYFIAVASLFFSTMGMAQTSWDFKVTSDADLTNLKAEWGTNDAGLSYVNTNVTIGKYSTTGIDSSAYFNDGAEAIKYATPVKANGVELESTKGLLFGYVSTSQNRFIINNGGVFRVFINNKSNGLHVGNVNGYFVIPNINQGDTITIVSRRVTGSCGLLPPTSLNVQSGFSLSSDNVFINNVGVSNKDGNVVIRMQGGVSYLTGIVIKKAVATGISMQTINNQKALSKAIYSIDGKYVGTQLNGLQKGIYIQGGKKILVN